MTRSGNFHLIGKLTSWSYLQKAFSADTNECSMWTGASLLSAIEESLSAQHFELFEKEFKLQLKSKTTRFGLL